MGRNTEKSRRSEQREKKKGSGGVAIDPEEEFKGAPHTFIINRGAVGKNVTRLIRDMRRVMEPFTASHLKTTKRNVLKDFVNVAGMLNVSHMLLFTKNENGTNLRVVRSPRGPTLTFHVEQYTLSSDIVSSLKRPNMEARQFLHHPLLVMNNFSGENKEMSLMATMFQNMFPSINVNKVKLNSIRRCVMINYNSETKMVEFRHYNIKAVPVGMSRGVKKLIKAKVPNLDRFDDVSEFLLKGGELSESEAELDGPHNEVILPQDVGSRGNIKSSKSAIRLTEIGPRMTLKLVKVEEGVCGGEVLYHKYRSLSADDIKYMQTKRQLKKETKEKRKMVQTENVKKKEAEKERLKQLSLDGMKKKAEEIKGDKDGSGSESEAEVPGDDVEVNDDDDDVEYYKEEVGEEPDEDTRLSLKRKRPSGPPKKPFKKKKFDNDKGQNSDKFDKGGRGGKTVRFNKDDKFNKGGKFDKGDKFGKDKFDKQGKTFGRGRGGTSRGGYEGSSRGGRGGTSRGGYEGSSRGGRGGTSRGGYEGSSRGGRGGSSRGGRGGSSRGGRGGTSRGGRGGSSRGGRGGKSRGARNDGRGKGTW